MNGCLFLIEVLLVDLGKDEKEIPHKSGKKTLVDVVKSSRFLGFRQADKKGRYFAALQDRTVTSVLGLSHFQYYERSS